jgi:hypothetical protein
VKKDEGTGDLEGPFGALKGGGMQSSNMELGETAKEQETQIIEGNRRPVEIMWDDERLKLKLGGGLNKKGFSFVKGCRCLVFVFYLFTPKAEEGRKINRPKDLPRCKGGEEGDSNVEVMVGYNDRQERRNVTSVKGSGTSQHGARHHSAPTAAGTDTCASNVGNRNDSAEVQDEVVGTKD